MLGSAVAVKSSITHWLRSLWRPEHRVRTVFQVVLGMFALAWLDWRCWHLLPVWLGWSIFTFVLGYGVWWLMRLGVVRRPVALQKWVPLTNAPRLTRFVAMSALLPVAWQWIYFQLELLRWSGLKSLVFVLGAAASFLTGLAWTVWAVERLSPRHTTARRADGKRLWHPLNLAACYYRQRVRRLDQSLATGAVYALAFLLVLGILGSLRSCREVYEMPAGGGEARLAQTIRVRKEIRKKFVLNPLSAVLFNPPPIENVPLQLEDLTKHAYTVGQGKGGTAGFAQGAARGKVRFIRLEYDGGDWDQDFGVGSDLNLLIEYGIRTGQPVANETESRKIHQLRAFPARKSPPLVYMTGQKAISVSAEEVDALREYLLDKHGMLFADNGGSTGWHGQFLELMRKVLPKIQPVRIPLDHAVHTAPYEIPFLPYVAPHGGKDALGWVVDGRLVVYYHPGDIGDAWADGHAGVKRSVWECCYQLGVNVIFYAHAEYNRWLEATEK